MLLLLVSQGSTRNSAARSEIAAFGGSDGVPQPFGLPNSFTTAGTAVISLSSQRIISLMAPAMNFVRAEREFRVPPVGGTYCAY